MDPLVRTLRLLALLQRRSFWRGDELADALDVDKRVLRRDIARLRALGYPIESDRGVGGGYGLGVGGTRLPPLVLDDDEATALVIGLRAVTGLAVAQIETIALQALTKIDALLPPALRERIEAVVEGVTWGQGPALEARFELSTLLALSHARRDGQVCELDYTRADGARARRRVEPHHIVAFARRWYLVAWDLERDDWRTFRLDRIEAPAATAQRFGARPLPSPSPTVWLLSSMHGAAAPVSAHELTAVIEGPAERVAARVGWLDNDLEPVDAAHVRVTLRDASPANLATALAALVADASLSVVGAPELDAPTRREVERLWGRLGQVLSAG